MENLWNNTVYKWLSMEAMEYLSNIYGIYLWSRGLFMNITICKWNIYGILMGITYGISHFQMNVWIIDIYHHLYISICIWKMEYLWIISFLEIYGKYHHLNMIYMGYIWIIYGISPSIYGISMAYLSNIFGLYLFFRSLSLSMEYHHLYIWNYMNMYDLYMGYSWISLWKN